MPRGISNMEWLQQWNVVIILDTLTDTKEKHRNQRTVSKEDDFIYLIIILILTFTKCARSTVKQLKRKNKISSFVFCHRLSLPVNLPQINETQHRQ